MKNFRARTMSSDDDTPTHLAARRFASDSSDHFRHLNEHPVNDVVLDFFYRPHTLTLLAGVIVFLVYTALTNDDSNRDENIWTALKVILLFFMIISCLAFPNGPFTRPHPVIWRMAFGLTVFYLLVLLFLLFQNFQDVKSMLRWLDPVRLNKAEFDEKEYAVNCSNLTLGRLYEGLDIFAVAHFLGWAMKALLLRHGVLCWYISISWEITELAFAHLLPNFSECWWDAILLDILLCNGLGIWFGMWICKKLEMRTYHWESIRHIKGTRRKIRRAVMQFTPESWTGFHWFSATSSRFFNPESTPMRTLAVAIIVIAWQICELNCFFLKHIFAVDTEHPINTYRIVLIGAISAPTLRQYYGYVTDPKCPRIGTQCWVYLSVVFTEAIICIKFGREMFLQTQLLYIGIWLVFLMIGSVLCVYISVVFARRSDVTREVHCNGEVMHRYLDSSYENLANTTDDQALLRRRRATTNNTTDGGGD